jgi:hypothetical protein
VKNIAIISLYGNNNFGNKLQNYAMQEILKNNGFNTTIIKNKISFEIIQDDLIHKIKSMIKTLINLKNFSNSHKRTKKFIQFNELMQYSLDNVNINIIPKKISGEYDYFLFGSDQLWSPFAGGGSKLYLGRFSENSKNISYAASFGVDNIPKELEKKYRIGLKNFKYISVREDRGKEIVEELTGRTDVEVLVDPTMLLTTGEWDKISIKPNMLKSDKYILNYFLGELSLERKKEIERVAKENDCEIINILDKNSPFYVCGPSEFLYLEKNAFLVCTDSFHSCIFAILYNRPFIIFDRDQKNIHSMNSRIDTLINKFNLKNRRYEGKITKENLEHDYSEAYVILEKEREKSDKFLRKALSINDIEGN